MRRDFAAMLAGLEESGDTFYVVLPDLSDRLNPDREKMDAVARRADIQKSLLGYWRWVLNSPRFRSGSRHGGFTKLETSTTAKETAAPGANCELQWNASPIAPPGRGCRCSARKPMAMKTRTPTVPARPRRLPVRKIRPVVTARTPRRVMNSLRGFEFCTAHQTGREARI